MQSLEDPDEETAFYDHDSDRAVAVLWPAIVENRLTGLLRSSLIPAPKEFDELFSPGRALGDFGLKIKIAYITGLIGKDVADDLRTLAKIRNAFAHRIDIKDFEHPPISSWLDSMRVVIVHRELLKNLRSKPDSGRTKSFVLEMELSDYRNTFHCCIRYLIHHIVALEKKRKALNNEINRQNS